MKPWSAIVRDAELILDRRARRGRSRDSRHCERKVCGSAATRRIRHQVLNFAGAIDGNIAQGRQHAAIADPEYRDSKSVVRHIKEGAGSIGRHSRGRVDLRGCSESPCVHQAAVRIYLESS